jgi:hypothetical protein
MITSLEAHCKSEPHAVLSTFTLASSLESEAGPDTTGHFFVAMGDRGCLSLFGSNAETHRMLGEHLTSEYVVRTVARGRSVDEWKHCPEQPDNHWFDCLVGSAVAGSMLGARLLEVGSTDPPNSQGRVSFRKLQRDRKK